MMRKVSVVLLAAAFLTMGTMLFGCSSQSAEQNGASGRIIFEETVSPNEDYVSSEEDIVCDTVRVTQDGSGAAIVAAESNSAFFDPITYQVECGGELEAEDVSVKWTTLMGGTEPSEDDQLIIAEVSIQTADGDSDVRKINFANRGLELISKADL